MGSICIIVEANDGRTDIDIRLKKSDMADLAVALAQLELAKVNILARIARQSNLKGGDL